MSLPTAAPPPVSGARKPILIGFCAHPGVPAPTARTSAPTTIIITVRFVIARSSSPGCGSSGCVLDELSVPIEDLDAAHEDDARLLLEVRHRLVEVARAMGDPTH